MEPKWEICEGSLEMRKLRSGRDLSEIALEDIKVKHLLGRRARVRILVSWLPIWSSSACVHTLIRISKHCVNVHSGPNVVLPSRYKCG